MDFLGWRAAILLGATTAATAAAMLLLLSWRTQRRALEDAKRKQRVAEQEFQDYLQLAAGWAWALDAELRFIAIGQLRHSHELYDPAALAGQYPWELPHPQADSGRMTALREALQQHIPLTLTDLRLLDDRGDERIVRLNAHPQFSGSGSFEGYRAVASDITEQIRVIRRAEAAERQLAEALESIPVGLVLYDAAERATHVNRRMAELVPVGQIGLHAGALLEDTVRSTETLVDHPGMSAEQWVQVRLANIRTCGPPLDTRLKDGRWMRTYDYALPEGGRAIMRFDVSETKRAEEALAQSQQLLQAVFETMPDPVSVQDSGGRYLMVNRAWMHAFGARSAETHAVADLSPVGQEARLLDGRAADWAAGQNRTGGVSEVRVTARDGTGRIYRVATASLADRGGSSAGFVSVSTDLTAEKEAQERARVADLLLAEAIESLPIGFILYDSDGRIVRTNRRLAVDVPVEDVGVQVGATFASLVPHLAQLVRHPTLDDAAWVRWRIDRFHNPEGPLDLELADGRWMRCYDFKVSGGSTLSLRMDVTDQKRSHEALLASEARLAQIFESVSEPISLYVEEPGGLFRALSVNSAYASLAGLSREQIEGRTVAELQPGSSGERLVQQFANALATRKPVRWESTMAHADGTITAIHDATPVLDAPGRSRQVVLFSLNVTAEREAESALRLSARRLALQHDVGRALSAAVTIPEAAPPVVEKICRALGWACGGIWQVDRVANVLRFSGGWRDPDSSLGPFLESRRSLTKAMGVGAAGSAWQKRAPLWLTARSGDPGNPWAAEPAAPMPVSRALEMDSVWDSGGPRWHAFPVEKFTQPGRLLARHHGLRTCLMFPILLQDKVFGVLELWGPESREVDQAVLRTLMSISTQIAQVMQTRQREEELHRATRLEAIGQLTGGVAHDFNNILTVIIGNMELVAENPAVDTIRERAKLVLEAATRAADLTRSLLAFSRKQTLAPRNTNVNEMVKGLSTLVHRTLGEDIELRLTLDPAATAAYVDRSHLESAILNLIINARDAMPVGGKLTIETSMLRLDESSSVTHPDATPGDYTVVTIADTGIGMSPEVLSRVFEPFFTTKGAGKGSGLGLSMVYGFVKQSGGHVWISSEVGHGTSVQLLLPLSARGIAASGTAHALDSVAQRGSEIVLVVEDEPRLRQLVSDQLLRLGYIVYSAENGPEAVRKNKDLERVDLLFTDMVLPGGLSGKQIAEACRKDRPGLKVLYTSGYSADAMTQQSQLEPGAILLQKPYRHADLAATVRRALSANGADRDASLARGQARIPMDGVARPT